MLLALGEAFGILSQTQRKNTFTAIEHRLYTNPKAPLALSKQGFRKKMRFAKPTVCA